jgi:TPR repeat protein
MKALILVLCIVQLMQGGEIFANPQIDRAFCKFAKTMAEAGDADSYAHYGSCLLDGIDGPPNIRKAKGSFLAGAKLGSAYSKYWAGNTLIFHPASSTEELKGRLLLNELASDSIYSSEARYALGVYEFNKGNFLSAQEFLEKAQTEGRLAASYVMLYYYFDKEKSQVDMQKVSRQLEKVKDVWVSSHPQSSVPTFSCWVSEASSKRVPLSTTTEVLGIIESKLGGCSAQTRQ